MIVVGPGGKSSSARWIAAGLDDLERDATRLYRRAHLTGDE